MSDTKEQIILLTEMLQKEMEAHKQTREVFLELHDKYRKLEKGKK